MVETLDRTWTGPTFEACNVVYADRTHGRRRHCQLGNTVDVAALIFQHADLHRVLFGPFSVPCDLIVARNHEAERISDGRHAYAEVCRPLSIDINANLRITDTNAYPRIRQARLLLSCTQQSQRIFAELVHVRTKKIRLNR